MRRILAALALCLLAIPALAQHTTSTSVSTDARTVLGQAPPLSWPGDYTTETFVQNSGTTIPTSAFTCGQGIVLTASTAVTVTLPPVAGSQPLLASCWFDLVYTGASTVTINICPVNTCGESAGVFDTINGASLTTITLGPSSALSQNSNAVRFFTYQTGLGGGIFYTLGLPPGYLGTITGYLSTVQTAKTAAYTFLQADCGTTIPYNSSSGANFTFPHNIVGACAINVKQLGSGKVTFVNDGTSTGPLNPHSFTQTVGANAMVTVENFNSVNAWTLEGDAQ